MDHTALQDQIDKLRADIRTYQAWAAVLPEDEALITLGFDTEDRALNLIEDLEALAAVS